VETTKVWTIEDLQDQVADTILYLFLSIGKPYYHEGEISSKTKDQKIKSAH
jgi:hypothetical protein